MNAKKVMGIVLSLSVFALVACSSFGQTPAETTKPEGSPITVKGKIDFMKNLDGYFILGDVPAREYIIMNENLTVLEELFASGKTVTIEGRMDRGADYLFIEKIDGKEYLGPMTQ